VKVGFECNMNNLEISKRLFINGGSGDGLLQGVEGGKQRKEQREHPKVS